MTTTQRSTWLAAPLCLSVASLAFAGSHEGGAASGDVKAGEQKAAICNTCHMPADFAGLSDAAIGAAIKTKGPGNTEKHPPVGELSDQDIADLAAHLAAASG